MQPDEKNRVSVPVDPALPPDDRFRVQCLSGNHAGPQWFAIDLASSPDSPQYWIPELRTVLSVLWVDVTVRTMADRQGRGDAAAAAHDQSWFPTSEKAEHRFTRRGTREK